MLREPLSGLRPRHLPLVIGLLVVLAFPPDAHSKREHLVYFSNTAYELNIYKIYGQRPGKTLMLIGGIQGNEPGGFLSADLYADTTLEKGNLIVVPRANFYSIILNKRGPGGDMNRKFTREDNADSMEDKIVTILKNLISESDYLLNLHDGAGYYYPKYINKWRNPMRFGQSIITDCEEYSIPGTDRTIKLYEMAQRVVDQVNPHIKNELYQFHVMNTKTADKESKHKEQRKSATYYALTSRHIPSFGVETSKFLPSIDLKVQYHNLVINAFMELFEIIPESPTMVLDPPTLKYLVVSINDNSPTVVKQGQAIEVQMGDSINVTHIESNYERGLSLDILGHGDLNDYRKDFEIHRNTSLVVRKDNHKVAEIPIRISSRQPQQTLTTTQLPEIKVDYFVIEAMGYRILVANGETLNLVRGEKMKIVDVWPPEAGSAGVKVNLKGFVGDEENNTGEDRGYVVDTATSLMKRWSVNKHGERYEMVATRDERTVAKATLRLTRPKMDYLLLRVNSHKRVLLRSDEAVSLSPDDEICFEDIHTNLHSISGVHLSINGHKLNPGEAFTLKEVCPPSESSPQQVKIQKGPLLLGKIVIEMRRMDGSRSNRSAELAPGFRADLAAPIE